VFGGVFIIDSGQILYRAFLYNGVVYVGHFLLYSVDKSLLWDAFSFE
jgi:hypothetical protein